MCAASCLNICFNTIALIFLLEFDDALYDVAVPGKARLHLANAAACVELSLPEQAALFRSKNVNALCIALSIIIGVAVLGNGESITVVAFIWTSACALTCLSN